MIHITLFEIIHNGNPSINPQAIDVTIPTSDLEAFRASLIGQLGLGNDYSVIFVYSDIGVV